MIQNWLSILELPGVIIFLKKTKGCHIKNHSEFHFSTYFIYLLVISSFSIRKYLLFQPNRAYKVCLRKIAYIPSLVVITPKSFLPEKFTFWEALKMVSYMTSAGTFSVHFIFSWELRIFKILNTLYITELIEMQVSAFSLLCACTLAHVSGWRHQLFVSAADNCLIKSWWECTAQSGSKCSGGSNL